MTLLQDTLTSPFVTFDQPEGEYVVTFTDRDTIYVTSDDLLVNGIKYRASFEVKRADNPIGYRIPIPWIRRTDGPGGATDSAQSKIYSSVTQIANIWLDGLWDPERTKAEQTALLRKAYHLRKVAEDAIAEYNAAVEAFDESAYELGDWVDGDERPNRVVVRDIPSARLEIV